MNIWNALDKAINLLFILEYNFQIIKICFIKINVMFPIFFINFPSLFVNYLH